MRLKRGRLYVVTGANVALLSHTDSPSHPGDDSMFMESLQDRDIVMIVGDEVRIDEWGLFNKLAMTRHGLGWVSDELLERVK